MPLPLVLGAAKGAIAAAKALKAAKAVKAVKTAKAAKAMGSAGKMKALSSKGASAIKGPSVKKELITKGSNNVGSKENLKAAKNRLKQTKKTDRLLNRDERRTNFKNKVGEMRENMDKKASESTSAPEGNEKTKKKESSQDIYNKTKASLERKNRRSVAMDNFATKGTMKQGGKYMDGGRKKPLKKLKGAIQKANYKAGAVKNKAEAKAASVAKKIAGAVKKANYKAGAAKNKAEGKVLDAIKRKKAEKGMKYENGGKKGGAAKKPTQASAARAKGSTKHIPDAIKRKKAMKLMREAGIYKNGGRKFPDLNKDGKVTMADILQGRGVKRANKGMKYKKGGKH